jgi:hypothetical protein
MNLLVCLLLAAQTPPTGTEPGQVLPGPFGAYVVFAGPKKPPGAEVQTEERQNFADAARAGKFHDFITRYGLDPTVAVFTREAPTADDAPLARLLKSLDAAVQKNRNARLHAFAVFLRLKDDFLKDESRVPQVKAIEKFGAGLDLKELPLAIARSESEKTKAFNLGADDVVTVIVYENLRVRAKFTFTADKPLDAAGIEAVEAEVRKMIKR